MNAKLVCAVLVVVASVGAGACGTTGTTGGAGGTGTGGATTATTDVTTTTNTTATTTSTGMAACPAPAGDTATDCTSACKTLWDCGEMATCNAGMTQLCPGFAPMGSLNQTAWTSSCSQACGALSDAQKMAYFAAIDTTDCVSTISMVSAASQTTGQVCQTGMAGG